jgi:hypothetical protein
MDDKTFAILIALISNVSAIFVAYITSRFAEKREFRSFSRQAKKERVERIKLLYEDTVFILSNIVIQKGRATAEQRIEFTRLEARLGLFSTKEVREQFLKTFELAQEMSAYARSAEPKRIDDKHILLESELSSHAKDYESKADELYPIYQKNFTTLKNLMIEHLEKLESEI